MRIAMNTTHSSRTTRIKNWPRAYQRCPILTVSLHPESHSFMAAPRLPYHPHQLLTLQCLDVECFVHCNDLIIHLLRMHQTIVHGAWQLLHHLHPSFMVSSEVWNRTRSKNRPYPPPIRMQMTWQDRTRVLNLRRAPLLLREPQR